jgi:hypothetical protein
MRKELGSRSRLFLTMAAIGGSLSLVLPAVADGIAAGQAITNKATASYDDGTTTYNATSNTVEIKVAEVAGITVAATNPSAPSANAGEVRDVIFTIANTGNDATQFVIPSPQINNLTDFEILGTPQIISVNGTATTIPLQPGVATGTPGYFPAASGIIPIAPGGASTVGTVQVKVQIRVKPSATVGATTNVTLGETATANAQNADYVAGTNDLKTQDNADGTTGESLVNGAPVNGVREAMATAGPITVGARPQAFATILESVSGYSNLGTPNPYTDDKLTFAITLKAENPATPPAGLTVTDLVGTSINLDGIAQTRILVSNAIPVGTVLSNVNPTPAAGWTTVYTISDLATTDPLNAIWTTVRPTTDIITRIGFVKTGSVAKGTSVPGFSFEVTPNATFAGGPIASIAQVFGQSGPGAVLAGTPTQIVYDESGDQASNNGLDGIDPNPVTNPGVPAGTGISKGIADPNDSDPTTGISADPTTKNTGTTAGGESTVYKIAGGLLNGPDGAPAATGTVGNTNDDFTSKSIVLPLGLDPAAPLPDADTPAITFKNTLRNDSPISQVITLVPTPPATPGAIPVGTTVTIDPDGPTGTGVPVVFTYDGTKYTTTGTPPQVTVLGNQIADYTTTVDLPAGVAQLTEFPVIITAFVDTDSDGIPDTDEVSNRTIDRLYTGYVSLKKEARILDGATEIVGFTTDAALLSPALRPGRIIEYRITYTNLSAVAPTGSTSVTLPANNLKITEDGLAAPNTWFGTTTDPVGTTNPGSAKDLTTGASITTTVNGTDIQTYVDQVTTVTPQGTGRFIFQRKVK